MESGCAIGRTKGLWGSVLGADSRAEASDPLAQWRTAAELNLVVSAPSSPSTLLSDNFAEVVKRFPDLQIVIEHLAGVGTEANATLRRIQTGSRFGETPQLDDQTAGLRGVLQPAVSIRGRAAASAYGCGSVRTATGDVGERLSAGQFEGRIPPFTSVPA